MKRILLVDDESNILDGLVIALSAALTSRSRPLSRAGNYTI